MFFFLFLLSPVKHFDVVCNKQFWICRILYTHSCALLSANTFYNNKSGNSKSHRLAIAIYLYAEVVLIFIGFVPILQSERTTKREKKSERERRRKNKQNRKYLRDTIHSVCATWTNCWPIKYRKRFIEPSRAWWWQCKNYKIECFMHHVYHGISTMRRKSNNKKPQKNRAKHVSFHMIICNLLFYYLVREIPISCGLFHLCRNMNIWIITFLTWIENEWNSQRILHTHTHTFSHIHSKI